jgi:hypothetical protein
MYYANQIYETIYQKLPILNTILKYGNIMTDPSGYITAKLAAMIGGFIGGSTILTFIRPKTIGEAFMRGGTSVGSSMIFSTPLLHALGWPTDWETQLMAGFCIGFVSYSILGMVANFFIKKKDNDIVEVVTDLRSAISSKTDKPKSE